MVSTVNYDKYNNYDTAIKYLRNKHIPIFFVTDCYLLSTVLNI